MTFEEWYLKNIKKNQDWPFDYKDSHIYWAMERVWDAAYEEGREDAFAMGTKS